MSVAVTDFPQIDLIRKRSRVSAVQLLREFPGALEGRPANQGSDIFDLPLLELDLARILPAIGIARGVVDRCFVKTRWQCGHIGQAVEDGAMVQFRDRSRDKNPEMRDVGNEDIDNPLPRPLQVLGVLVNDGNVSMKRVHRPQTSR